jgi:hypothetical protein
MLPLRLSGDFSIRFPTNILHSFLASPVRQSETSFTTAHKTRNNVTLQLNTAIQLYPSAEHRTASTDINRAACTCRVKPRRVRSSPGNTHMCVRTGPQRPISWPAPLQNLSTQTNINISICKPLEGPSAPRPS